ncbi:MAG: cysteine--tRNA ligase [Kiritimatiellaeota bacterium]|nr:cysteine--tRNA ligase [Kiritimatiellota bacterium]
MQFFNSMSRGKEAFAPIEQGHVRMYTCGPTVYNFAHIGNFRAYTFEDILRRVLAFNGCAVTQVMNLTDVDDKTIRGAAAAGVPLKDFTAPFVAAFYDDLKTLNILPAEVYPAATDHVAEMIALVQRLFDKGLAYQSEDGSVYFSVAKFQGYGKLAHLDPKDLRMGARVADDEYEKEGYGDFALWKAWEASDGDVVWDSPWGRGRPGWHLECSAMAMKYLGDTFDIHTGGIDNLFPHHENEVAQTEGATGRPFVNLWMHCAHLRVNGEKMSKSLGNFYTLRDLLGKGYTGREIRYVLINGHYRQPLNFTFDALEAARSSLARIDECVDALTEEVRKFESSKVLKLGGATEWAESCKREFAKAVNDDLNIPEAFAALFALVRESNSALHRGVLKPEEAKAVLELFDEVDAVLGVVRFGRIAQGDAIPADIVALVEARAAARAAKQWAESDRLRDELAAKGWEVRDAKDGQKVKRM